MELSTLSLWLVAAPPVLILSLIACDQLKLTHYAAEGWLDTYFTLN